MFIVWYENKLKLHVTTFCNLNQNKPYSQYRYFNTPKISRKTGLIWKTYFVWLIFKSSCNFKIFIDMLKSFYRYYIIYRSIYINLLCQPLFFLSIFHSLIKLASFLGASLAFFAVSFGKLEKCENRTGWCGQDETAGRIDLRKATLNLRNAINWMKSVKMKRSHQHRRQH